MEQKKLVTIIILFCGAIAVWIGLKKNIQQNAPATAYTIGILQTATHPALDMARQGFMDELTVRLGKQVTFVVKNGEGSVANIHTLAEHFHLNNDINALFAIASPAAQALTSMEKNKPVFIAAISDPLALGVTADTQNVCGITDMHDINFQINTLIQLLPTCTSVAIIYNNAEINSIAQVARMESALRQYSIGVHKIGITSQLDIAVAVNQAVRNADAILAPTDNMIANAITVVTDLARQANKPFITSDILLVPYGALFGSGVDFYDCGTEVGRQAVEVVQHNKKPLDFGIKASKNNKIVINQERFDHFQLELPYSLKSLVSFVEPSNF